MSIYHIIFINSNGTHAAGRGTIGFFRSVLVQTWITPTIIRRPVLKLFNECIVKLNVTRYTAFQELRAFFLSLPRNCDQRGIKTRSIGLFCAIYSRDDHREWIV